MATEKKISKSDPAARFWSKVQKTSSCWEWTASLTCGYGRFFVFKKGLIGFRRCIVGAHRYSWELRHGAIPKGMFVCHRCDNSKCVNPDHLFLGTQKDNMQDCLQKGRMVKPPVRKRKTHCRRGHPFTGVSSRGAQTCQYCQTIIKLRRTINNE